MKNKYLMMIFNKKVCWFQICSRKNLIIRDFFISQNLFSVNYVLYFIVFEFIIIFKWQLDILDVEFFWIILLVDKIFFYMFIFQFF